MVKFVEMAAVGRPTKYDDVMLQKAQAYVHRREEEQTMPFIEELALHLGVNEDTLVEWGKEHEEFSAAIRRLKTLQKLDLKKGALEKKLQCNVAIFLLRANHGLDEKRPEQTPLIVILRKFDKPKDSEEMNIV